MKIIVFIIALVTGAISLVVFNQIKKENAPVTPRLVANIGMPMDEVKRKSTAGVIGKGVYAGEVAGNARNWTFYREGEAFDWEVAGTGLKFAGCKYFRLQTADNDDPHLVYLWVTTAQKKLTYTELKAEMLAIQQRILADGWKPTYRTKDNVPSDVQLKQYLEQPEPDSSGVYGTGASYFKGDAVMIFIGTQLYTDPLIVKDAMRQDVFYHRIEMQPRDIWEKDWQGGRYTAHKELDKNISTMPPCRSVE